MLREERNVMIRRNGKIKTKSVHNLYVGDIIFINQGDQLPVDCVFLSGSSMVVDESHQTGEAKEIEKTPLNAMKILDNSGNPFLISGSIIKEGKGEAVVCAVGQFTSMGRIRAKLEEEPDPTPLQVKLQSIVIGKKYILLIRSSDM